MIECFPFSLLAILACYQASRDFKTKGNWRSASRALFLYPRISVCQEKLRFVCCRLSEFLRFLKRCRLVRSLKRTGCSCFGVSNYIRKGFEECQEGGYVIQVMYLIRE